MIKRLISKVIQRRHYWRTVGFDELSELYTSMMFRSLALSLVGIFVPIYLYDLGFSIVSIMGFYSLFFATRIPMDFVAGWLAAKHGPKRTMVVSYLSYVLVLAMFTSYEQFAWPLVLLAIVWGVSNSLFFVPFHTNFSKIKHSKHSGRELGVLSIMERVGATMGPLVGGIVATIFGPEYTFFAASVFFAVAVIPLFMSREAVRANQTLDYNGFDVWRLRRDLFSHSFLGIENTTSVVIWPLFLALFVVPDNAYMKVGILSSFGVVVSVALTRVVGRLVDKNKGRELLRSGATAKGVLHIVRPFVGSFGLAMAFNFIHEALTISARLPYVKGLYDRADEFEGYRIVYIVSVEAFSSMTKSLFYLLLTLIATGLSGYAVLSGAFLIAAISSFGIMTERFPALDKKE